MSHDAETGVTHAETPAASRHPRLWHAATNAHEHAKALSGEPFRTRCGQVGGSNGGGKRAPRKARDLSPMEPCAVCRLLLTATETATPDPAANQPVRPDRSDSER